MPVDDDSYGSSSVEEECEGEKMSMTMDVKSQNTALRLPLDRRSNNRPLLVEEIVA